MAARARGKRGRGKPKKSAKTSSISELDALTLRADDLAILSAYIEIISNIVGLWSLYLAKIEDTISAQQDQEGEGAPDQATIPAGAVRSNHRRKKNKKRKA